LYIAIFTFLEGMRQHGIIMYLHHRENLKSLKRINSIDA
jgi:hypothetical protein